MDRSTKVTKTSQMSTKKKRTPGLSQFPGDEPWRCQLQEVSEGEPHANAIPKCREICQKLHSHPKGLDDTKTERKNENCSWHRVSFHTQAGASMTFLTSQFLPRVTGLEAAVPQARGYEDTLVLKGQKAAGAAQAFFSGQNSSIHSTTSGYKEAYNHRVCSPAGLMASNDKNKWKH